MTYGRWCECSSSDIFVLVNALAKRDRKTALRSLDILVRDGEYLPLHSRSSVRSFGWHWRLKRRA